MMKALIAIQDFRLAVRRHNRRLMAVFTLDVVVGLSAFVAFLRFRRELQQVGVQWFGADAVGTMIPIGLMVLVILSLWGVGRVASSDRSLTCPSCLKPLWKPLSRNCVDRFLAGNTCPNCGRQVFIEATAMPPVDR